MPVVLPPRPRAIDLNHGRRIQDTRPLERCQPCVCERPRFLPVGVSGVYNWRGTIGKTVGPDGSRMDVKGAILDLDWIVWAGRRVVVAYDADAVTKELVRIARSALAAHLRGRGALVGFLEWDAATGKGIDDHSRQCWSRHGP
jgi:hypothetical protein